MIDHGDTINAQFYIKEKLTGELTANVVKDSPFNRMGLFNRVRHNNISDITYMQLSING